MAKKVTNLMRQLQTIIVYDPANKCGCTKHLMPKGKSGSSITIQDDEISGDVTRRVSKKILKIEDVV